ncbi:MAG: amino acid ABC transporter ATP-binding protein, partial [Candidatus Electrothrix sp. AR3]|nr:amino acid ABC transporter ATP-binding protein [Candidatus Electrothrix sp. AR3]
MIRFEQVHKWYGEHHVLDDVSFHVPKGTLCILCGKSGAGKSTLLSTVNGLESIDKGSIFVDGVQVTSKMKNLQALRMQIGMVFQDYNLFLHMTIERNIRLGLEKALRLSKKEAIWRTHKYLERVGLLEKKNAYPAELSGGQQQRVAIARCLAMQTKSLLLDEPTPTE